MGVRSSSKPNLVFARPLRPCSVTWQSSLVANLSSTAPGRALGIEAKAHAVVGCHHMAVTTLARSLIWLCNSSMFSCYSSSFSVSPSLASKPVRCRLSLRSSYLGVSAKVSIARLTTLAFIVVHLGCSVDATLAVTVVPASCSIS